MKKQQTRNKLTRITIALLLILSMLGNTLILPAVAQQEITSADETILPETPLDGVSDATGLPTLPEPILLTAADIPEFISSAELTERGAVERMRAEETTMSNVIFRNADGTRTMYMYGLPVKYTALDGTVRDKSTNLVSVSTASVLLSDQPVAQAMAQTSTAQRELLQTELGVLDVERAADTLHMLSTALTSRGKSLSDMAYTTLDNDVYALFPTNLAQGLTLVFGEHSVRMTPAGTGMTVTAGGNVTKTTTSSLSDANVTERLLYPNVFGPGTAVQYTPTLTGVKEEILLARNVGKNSFAFLLETGGLVLTQQNGQYVLVDPTVGETVGSLGSIIVYDSAGQITLGTMTAQTILAGQKYGITISVEQEFLAGATYPVSIDPTITFQTGTTGVIEDLGLYNHADAWSASADEMHYVGLTVIRDYTGAALYRFPFIYDSTQSAFGGLPGNPLFTAAQVGKATLRINVSRISSTEVTLNMKRSNVTWSANGRRICDAAIFASAMSGSNLLSSPVSTPQSGTVDLDLTKIMRDWISFEAGVSTKADPEKGVLLYSNHPSVSLAVNSIRGYDATKYPSLIIEYITQEQTGPYYLNNKGNQSFLTYTENFEVGMARGRVADLGTSMEWVLSYQGDGKYALTPSDYESIWYLNYRGGLSLCTGNPVPHSTWTIMTDNTDFVFRNVSYSDTALSYTTDVYTMIDNVSCNELAETVTSINDTAITTPFKWRMIHKSAYVEFPLITLTEIALEPEQVDMYEYLNADNYSLTDPSSDLYIYGAGGTTCTVVNGVITPVTPGGSFTINVNHRPSAQFVSFTVHIGAITEGTYFIQNTGEDVYLFAGTSLPEEGLLHQGEWHFVIDETNVIGLPFVGHICLKWEVELRNGGYYTIKIVDSDDIEYYMVYLCNSATSDYSIIVDDNVGIWAEDVAKWNIQMSSNGGLTVSPHSNLTQNLMFQNNAGFAVGTSEEENAKSSWLFRKTDVELSTPLIAQQTNSWCWVASAQMLARTNSPTDANIGDVSTILLEQRKAVYYVFGENGNSATTYDWSTDAQGLKNKLGAYWNVAKAAAYLLEENGDEGTFIGYLTPYDEETLFNFISDGYAVARLYAWVEVNLPVPETEGEYATVLSSLNDDSFNGGAHVTVIKGVQWSDNKSCLVFTVFDPANRGTQEEMTYEELALGIESNGNNGFTAWIWFPTVVTKTDYCTKTLLEEIVSFEYDAEP